MATGEESNFLEKSSEGGKGVVCLPLRAIMVELSDSFSMLEPKLVPSSSG